MKAIVLTRYGTPDDLELREVDKPVPADDQVLIKVHASAVNIGTGALSEANRCSCVPLAVC